MAEWRDFTRGRGNGQKPSRGGGGVKLGPGSQQADLTDNHEGLIESWIVDKHTGVIKPNDDNDMGGIYRPDDLVRGSLLISASVVICPQHASIMCAHGGRQKPSRDCLKKGAGSKTFGMTFDLRAFGVAHLQSACFHVDVHRTHDTEAAVGRRGQNDWNPPVCAVSTDDQIWYIAVQKISDLVADVDADQAPRAQRAYLDVGLDMSMTSRMPLLGGLTVSTNMVIAVTPEFGPKSAGDVASTFLLLQRCVVSTANGGAAPISAHATVLLPSIRPSRHSILATNFTNLTNCSSCHS